MTTTAAEKTGTDRTGTTGITTGTGTTGREKAGTDRTGSQKTVKEKTGTENTGTENTGAHTSEAVGVITGARERIDALDDRIIGLIQERMAVSAVIQDARIASGGRRVNLSREMEILGRYREALGKPGTSLAMTLLELCRGRV
ncbi:chorismate mutase [Streptomyces bullii]|uniref:Chorismate mutase n=1 Tax=Streptomyces bullii TaxID=349910 RepID=A0ABW0V1C8_9ACTN